MFATKPGAIHQQSFDELLRFSGLIPAQLRSISPSGDDTTSPHSGARSERLRWMLFSRTFYRGRESSARARKHHGETLGLCIGARCGRFADCVYPVAWIRGNNREESERTRRCKRADGLWF